MPKPRQKSSKMLGGEPVERSKKILFLKGKHSSQELNDLVTDLKMISKPNCHALTRNNDIVPFEDPQSLEFLSGKNECGLFSMCSSTKKRPNNLVIGRVFEEQLLDMYEFGVEDIVTMREHAGEKKTFGSKPAILFLGDQWENDSAFTNIQNLLLDYFRGYKPDRIVLTGIDHIITCAVNDGKIFVRSYLCKYKQAEGTHVPIPVLHPMGPDFNLTLRRKQSAPSDLWKAAIKKPKNLTEAKVKNIKRNDLGDKTARIHMKKQNLDRMKVRRTAALRNQKPTGGASDGEPAAKRARN